MNCPQCNKTVEQGAVFCGNCGQSLTSAPIAPTYVPAPNVQPLSQQVPPPGFQPAVPGYAAATPLQQKQETKALLSVIFGSVAIPFCLIPIIGLVIGIAGAVLGTLSRGSAKKTLSTIGLIISCIAILAALGMWAYNLNQKNTEKKRNKSTGESTAIVSTSIIRTPCYSISFTKTMNTDNDKNDSCDVRAYEGPTIEQSNVIYKVYGNQVNNITNENFHNIAKTALEKDISATLPGFTIDSERTAEFAGSPAYIVNATNGEIAVVEAAIFRKVGAGYNLFSVVHATKGKTTDLKALEAQWQWK